MTVATKKDLAKAAKEAADLAEQALKGKNDQPPTGTPSPEQVFGAPTVRKGESVLTSRGYRILNLIRAKINQENGVPDPWAHARVEQGIHQKFQKLYPHGASPVAAFEGGMLAPFGSELLHDDLGGKDGDLGREIKSLLYAGVENLDPEEIFHQAKRYDALEMAASRPARFGTKASAQGWLDETLGGALVGPPQFGEPIALWRNQDAIVRAGATVGPMPHTGRFVAPRQTNASTAYWVGEAAAGTATNIKTGQITWTAKKLMCLLVYNREFAMFAGSAGEMLLRLDLARSMVLGADQAFLEGVGTDTKPAGLINNPNIQSVAPTTAAAGNNGALLAPQDIYLFNSAVEENNIPDDSGCCFIMRPKMYYALLRKRMDAAVAQDAAGPFAYSPFRQLGDAVNNKNINGQRVVTTTQVSQSRVQGTNTALTYMLYGYWPDYLILMSPMMEFIVATQGNPAGLGDLFQQDQFALKSILFCDGAARHPGGFAWADKLQAA